MEVMFFEVGSILNRNFQESDSQLWVPETSAREQASDSGKVDNKVAAGLLISISSI